MGKTDPIKEAADKQAGFNEYLLQIENDLKSRCASDSEHFDRNVEEYYKGADMNIMAQGEKWDFRQTHDFGIENIEKMVRGTVDCLFSGKSAEDKPGESVQTETLSDELVAAMKTIVRYKDFAANMATAFIVGMMRAFSSETEIKYSYSFSSMTLAPGLALHVAAANDSFSNTRFLSGDKIIESYLKFKLVFSYGRGYADFGIDNFNKMMLTLNKCSAGYLDSIASYMQMIDDPDASEDELDRFERRLDRSKRLLDRTKDELKDFMEGVGANPALRSVNAPRIASLDEADGGVPAPCSLASVTSPRSARIHRLMLD